jgi:ferredoxin
MIATFVVDQPSCIGCGTCWVSLPRLFREELVGEASKAATTGHAVEDEASLRLAAEACPSLSIQLFDPDGLLIYPTPEHRAERERQAAW